MQRAEKKKRKVARYKGSKEYGVPAAKVQLADSPLFEHAGLLFLLFSSPLSLSLPPPRLLFSLTGPHASLRSRDARACLRAYPQGYARFMRARVYTMKFIHAVHTRCVRDTSLSENRLSTYRPSTAAPAIFVLQKKIFESNTEPSSTTGYYADHWRSSIVDFRYFPVVGWRFCPRKIVNGR